MTNELLVAFLMGLLGSTHCIGMCGGIVSAISIPATDPRKSPLVFNLAYNLGRISSYTLAGLLLSLIGLQLLSTLPEPHLVGRTISGVFMILVGLYISRLWAGLVWLERGGAVLWKSIEPFGKRFLPPQNPLQAFALGMVWGWLPCGLVYSALILTLSGAGSQYASLSMAAFGLGTLPMLLFMGHSAASLKRWLQKKAVAMTAGMIVILLGVLQLGGWLMDHQCAIDSLCLT